jgi:hypothetical protein
MPMVGYCKDCHFWKDMECHGMKDDMEDMDEGNACIHVTVADDHDLEVKLYTGPHFGCINFIQREGNDG